MKDIGEKAPDFAQPDQHGNVLTLGDALSRGRLLLYFYPADFTPVCTAESCAFRDRYDDVTDVGAEIIGVSPQSVASHQQFASQFDLPFSLLSDPQREMVNAYGVAGPFGFGVRRVTFLIDADGIIRNRVVSDFFVGSHMKLLEETVAGA